MKFEDLHTVDYKETWDLQKKKFDDVLDGKCEDTTLLCEHPHVYTLGKHGSESNLLVNEEFLQTIGAQFYHIDRGGDITYHGPGQMVVYPILNLNNYQLSLKRYIYTLEETIIETVSHWGLKAIRKPGATGVWIDDSLGERKICAIGVKASHFVTMHGLALNVNTNLKYFTYINPCGFLDKGVTSISKETGQIIEMDEVKSIFCQKFCSMLEK